MFEVSGHSEYMTDMFEDSGSDDLFNTSPPPKTENKKSAPGSADGFFGKPADNFLSNTAPQPQVQSTILVDWEKKKIQETNKLDDELLAKDKKMYEKAREELDQYFNKIKEAQEKRLEHNKEVEKAIIEELQKESQNKWETVVNYIDFNRSDLHKKDISRMKSLLLQLKH